MYIYTVYVCVYIYMRQTSFLEVVMVAAASQASQMNWVLQYGFL